MRIRTNAKVNLLLSVRDRRPDGYHEIETVLQSVGLADDLTIAPTSSNDVAIRMHADGSRGAPIPSERDNLVYRAAHELIRRGVRSNGAMIDLAKRIPLAAGLGGGSANAAGALHGLNDLWNAGLSEQELVAVAADVGSDVPACVLGGAVVARGRGESVRRVPAMTAWFVLGISGPSLSTRDVYAGWKAHASGRRVGAAAMAAALADGDVERVAGEAHNDLEPAAIALRPDLEARRAALSDAGALAALVSGSGPTVFGIARDETHAREVSARAAHAFDRVEVVPSRPRCVERGEHGGEEALD